MRRIATILSVAAAALMITAVPLLADEENWGIRDPEGMNLERDECLLVAMNCKDQVDSLQQRIDRLQNEIARGSDVYTADELSILNNKLEDANRTMDILLEGGGS